MLRLIFFETYERHDPSNLSGNLWLRLSIWFCTRVLVLYSHSVYSARKSKTKILLISHPIFIPEPCTRGAHRAKPTPRVYRTAIYTGEKDKVWCEHRVSICTRSCRFKIYVYKFCSKFSSTKTLQKDVLYFVKLIKVLQKKKMYIYNDRCTSAFQIIPAV
jgi:hypothetical protein